MQSYLKQVESPSDIKSLDVCQLGILSEEIRKVLIENILAEGGHLGSNLAVVETTVALHYVYDSPKDKIIFDVSHQSYTHKILTGRKEAYIDPRHFGEVSGFMNPDESEHDLFELGHTSTSVSLACGLAKARDLKGSDEQIVALIGDGALSGGEAFEGLDQAAMLDSSLVIIVNDNEMSIAQNQGGIYKNLEMLRSSNGMGSPNLFKAMGLDYIYVEDGHDVGSIVSALRDAKSKNHACVVHIHTIKGKGYKWAEENREAGHKVGKNGSCPSKPKEGSYEAMTAQYLSDRVENDPRLLVISAATPRANGLYPEFRELAKKQFVDVGIAEEHAVAFASGAAAGGVHPVYLAYSTFIQRTYDQIMQDLSLNGSPATILLFRSGVEGGAATHSGVYDISMISNIPGVKCLSPATKEEYLSCLDWSIEQEEGPVVIRVPRTVIDEPSFDNCGWSGNVSYRYMQEGSRVALVALGSTLKEAREASCEVESKFGFKPSIINPRIYSDLDGEFLEKLESNHELVITLENGIVDGGFGQKIATYYGARPMKVVCLGCKKEFFDYLSCATQLNDAGITNEGILKTVAGNINA